MDGLLGFAEVIALLIMGGILMLLFVGRTRRGGHVLKPTVFEFGRWCRPLIYVEARPVGVLPRLVAFVRRREMLTTLDTDMKDGKKLHYCSDGLWKKDHVEIHLSPETEVDTVERQSYSYLAATAVIAFLLVIYAGAHRLTAGWAFAGMTTAGLGAVACGLQRTIDLTIKSISGTKVVMSFTAWSRGSAVGAQEVSDLGDFIRKLAKDLPLPDDEEPAA